MKKYTIVGLGEILWDMLPKGKQLGGAPTNFAYHAAKLGNNAVAASRIGKDAIGDEIISTLKKLSLSADYIQPDTVHPTGTVKVDVSDTGQPTYTIVENVAWDFIEFDDKLKSLAGRADAVCFGSLAQRSPKSRQTIQQFLSAMKSSALKVFDINLRQHFYDRAVVEQSIKLSNIIKLNDEELPKIADLLGIAGSSLEEQAKNLKKIYNLEIICVTRGENGCLLVGKDKIAAHPGFKVDVVDTVGSGDAFTACMVHLYLQGADLQTIAEKANRLGSFIASQHGATPEIDGKILEKILN